MAKMLDRSRDGAFIHAFQVLLSSFLSHRNLQSEDLMAQSIGDFLKHKLVVSCVNGNFPLPGLILFTLSPAQLPPYMALEYDPKIS